MADVVIGLATDADEAAWDAFVSSHPEAPGYHQWAWRGVFVRAFGHEALYLIARDSQHQIAGVLPLVHINSRLFGRTLTSLPFVNYGGVLAASDAVAESLVDAAADLGRARRCRHVELRHVVRRFPLLPFRQHKVAMRLTLEAKLWDRLDRKVRNQIRKAQKSGLTVDCGGAELRNDFYTVFARNMRDLGTPVYSPRLFDEVLHAFPAAARLHVVRLEGKPIAAGLTFRHGSTMEIPWASSVRDYNALCPNHLLYWNALETAVQEGCTVFDFGRSTPNEGPYKFKEQWDAQPLPLNWEYRLIDGHDVPNVGTSNPKYRLVIEAWKRLPLPVATTLGPHIVRAIP